MPQSRALAGVSVPLLHCGAGPHVDALGAMDLRVDLASLPAESPGQRPGRSLDHQLLLAHLSGRRRNLSADESRADQQESRGSLQCLANRLTVAKRAQSQHVVNSWDIWDVARRSPKAEDESVECDLFADLERQLAHR